MATVANIVAGKPVSAGGGVQYGPLGTVLPTDTTTETDGAFVKAGYISDEGLTETTERSTEKVRAWGGDQVKVLQTEFGATFSFTFIESINADVLKAVYGDDNVTVTEATSSAGTQTATKVVSDQLPHKAWVFDVKDGDARVRICVPDGQITEVGDITYNDGEVIGYQVTVETFLDSTLGGYYVKYTDNGVKASGG